MKKNASRYGLCSLAIASLTLFCTVAFAQDATLTVTPTSGSELLTVTVTNTVTLSDPNSGWSTATIDPIINGIDYPAYTEWYPPRGSGTVQFIFSLGALYFPWALAHGTSPALIRETCPMTMVTGSCTEAQ